MSILRAEDADFAVTGRTLPASKYRVTVLDARVEPGPQPNTSRLMRMYGNIRTPDGATELPPVNGGAPFRIGARKLFARSWIEHPNEQAQSIGNREIKHEAVAVGLMQKPVKGEVVELNVDEAYASQLVGKDVLVSTRVRVTYKNKLTGQIVKTPTPEQLSNGELERDEQAEIAAWLTP
ncbi:MAG: hypothetical protein L0Z53_06695 [Acidobacteriales bacterium]|nr:hypothetical protein [Terriglobales bacterium]